MSVPNISNSDMIHNKSFQFHHRKASKELEVFEAARYFSEYNEPSLAAESANLSSSTKFTQKVKKKKDKGWIKGRISLDMNLPMKNILNLPPQNFSSANYSNSFIDHQKPSKEKMIKLTKQPKPSSPGGKLASFLKKMIIKTKSPIQSMELDNIEEKHDHDQENSKRRISISHLQTPTKSYKEFLSFSKFNRHLRSAVALPKSSSAAMDERRNKVEMDEKCKLRDGVLEKQKKKKKKNQNLDDFEKFNETDDDGNETDSSSDLFELQIYDLDYYSNGLPVYESTDIDSIKRRNSISNILH